jgi:hypothetical protein
MQAMDATKHSGTAADNIVTTSQKKGVELRYY